MNGKFNPEGKLSADRKTVTVTGPVEADPGTQVDLLVVVLWGNSGKIALGRSDRITFTRSRRKREWTATVEDRDGGELEEGPATGWAAASVVTDDGDDRYGGPWRVSTYSWDVPIHIVSSDDETYPGG